MNIYRKISLSVAAVLSVGVVSTAVMAQTLGSGAPLNLNQILSGKAAGSSSSSNVRPYTYSGGADYTLGINPVTAMHNRARRDAFAQAQSNVTSDYMNQSYLDGEYQKAFDKYQAQFRPDGGASSSSSVVPTNVKVKYNDNKKKNFVIPKRVFRSY